MTSQTKHGEYARLSSTDYEDEWCSLSDGHLTVNKAYDRLGGSHKFKLQDLKWITTGHDLNLSRWAYKGWGVGLTGINWARDMSRTPLNLNKTPDGHKTVIIKKKGDFLRTGFTCEDPAKLFEAIEGQAPGLVQHHLSE